ncbi:MAG: hypothetical protein ABJA49_02105 [Betaproteobacteria bacterium]
MLLGETIEKQFVLATVPVLLGVVLVSGHGAVLLLWQRIVGRCAPIRSMADAVAQKPTV